jgi:phosphohistidine phosphatase
MEIYLLRHGLAVERETPGLDDEARPLTPRGKRQLLKAAAMLKKRERRFDLILSSPLVRARQTAEIVAGKLKLDNRLKFSRALAPGGRPKDLVAELNRQVSSAVQAVLLVGHEPDLSRLISLWTTGGHQLEMDFKKGGLAQLRAESLAAGKCATLEWLLTPKQMKWMA